MTGASHHARLRIPARGARAGFTLLEVILAVLILMFLAIGIHKFVSSNLRAIHFSVEDTKDQLAIERLVALIQEELYSIPPRTQSSLLGEGYKVSNVYYDQLEWRSRGGPGLMTTAASGEYSVKLQMKEAKKGSGKYEIGFLRRPVLIDTQGALVAAGNDKDATWVPLLPDAAELKIRYWDSRVGTITDRWTEVAVRPSLVILSIMRQGDAAPYEAVLTVPAALTQQ